MGAVRFDSNRLSVRVLADRYQSGTLNLEPVFQRDGVWDESQRKHLLDSIFRGYPIPAVFLYRHVDDATGTTKFEVIDGKQRLESLFMYMGLMRGRFAAPFLMDDGKVIPTDWRSLCKLKQQSCVEEYLIQVIEVTAPGPNDIVELFVRLNSTGKALTGQEIRNAKFYRSEFLKSAKRLASRYEQWLREKGVIGAEQARRMKHIELISELLYAASIGGVGSKKRVLDTVMRSDGLTGASLRKAEAAVVSGLNRLRRMFPALSKSVRFHKLSDFYSLAIIIQSLERKGLILDDRKRNGLAWELLVALSVGVDELSSRSKKLDFKALSVRDDLFRQYLQAVREGSDSESNRRKRHDLLASILEPIYQRKDDQRLFSPEQRRILWNISTQRACAECNVPLTWADFQADHIKPFSLGGKTALENAAMLCAKHNAGKGKKTKRAA